MGHQFRPKWPQVEAYQLVFDTDGETTTAYPQWFLQALGNRDFLANSDGSIQVNRGVSIEEAHETDWILAVNGEYFVVPDDVFTELFEPIAH